MAELLPSEIAIARLEEFLGQNGLGNAPMDAGSLSGVMSSGFAPFFGGAQRNMARNMRSQDMVRRISEDNERVNAAVTWMGRQGANLNPEARKTTKQLLSSMWNSQFFSEHVGGSDIDLAFGIQNAVQASGFRVAGQRVMGSGPVSDQLTMDMWKGADKYFFEGGFGNLRRTQGFDRTQIGQIASALGARGAFAGMDASKDISYDSKTGNYRLGDSSKLQDSFNTKVAELAVPLRMLQDIVGPKAINELVSLAESLSGISAGAKDAKQKITRTLMEATGAAASLGVDPHHFLNSQGRVMEGFMNLGYSGANAAQAAATTTPYGFMRARASQEAAERSSFFLPVLTPNQATAGMMTQMAAFQKDPRMQAYAGVLQILQNDLAKPEDRARLEALLSSSEPSEDQLYAIMKEFSAFTGGGSVEQAIANRPGGMDGLLKTLNADSLRKFNRTSQNVLSRRGQTQHLKANLYKMNPELAMQFGAENVKPLIELHTTLASTLLGANYDKIPSILEGEDPRAALEAMFAKDIGAQTMSPEERTAQINEIMRLRQHVGRFKNILTTGKASNPLNPDNMSRGDRIEAAERLASGASIFEDRTPMDATPLGGILRGFFNKGTVTDGQVMLLARMKRDRAVLGDGAFPGVDELNERVSQAVREKGMWNGLGRFDMDLAVNGTAAEKAAQEAVIRAVYQDDSPNKTSAQLDALVRSTMSRFKAGGEDGANAYLDFLSMANGSGGSASKADKPRSFDYLSKQAKKPLEEFTQTGSTNLAAYELMRSLGLLNQEDADNFTSAANKFDAESMAKLTVSDDQLKATAMKMTEGSNMQAHRGSWDRAMRVGGMSERYEKILTGLRQETLEAAAKAKTAGKTDEHKELTDKANRYGDMLDSATSGMSGKILTISNFGQAVLSVIENNSKKETSSSTTPTK